MNVDRGGRQGSGPGGKLGLGLLLVVCVWACATLLSARAATAQPLVTGVTFVGDTEPLAYQRVAGVGAEMVRVLVRWSEVAPTALPSSWRPEDPADPNYRWTAVDTEVVRAVEAGLTPVITIHGAPDWAQRCSGGPRGSTCDPDPSDLAAFATAAARRYSGQFPGLPRVHYWQGLNEPNLSIYFWPQFKHGKPASPRLYRTLINSFYFAVKSVARSNVVLAAGLGPIAVPHLTIGPLRFTRELLCMKGRRNPRPVAGTCEGGVHFDVFDIHPYTTGGPFHAGPADDVELGSLARLQELLQAADKAGRIKGAHRHTPLWITEFSWDSKPPDPGGLPMRILTRWTAEALYRSWLAGVSHFFWLSLRDNPPLANVPFEDSIEAGLYFRGSSLDQDRPKKAMFAFRFPFVAYSTRNGFFFWGRTPSSEAGRVAIQVHLDGGWRNVFAAGADGNGIFTGRVDGRYPIDGSVRARHEGEASVPFSLRRVKGFHQAPFG